MKTPIILGLLAWMSFALCACTPEQQQDFASGWARGAAVGRQIRGEIINGLANYATGYSEAYQAYQYSHPYVSQPHGTAVIWVDGEGHFVSY